MAISFAHTHVGKRPPFSYSLPWPLHKNCLPYPPCYICFFAPALAYICFFCTIQPRRALSVHLLQKHNLPTTFHKTLYFSRFFTSHWPQKPISTVLFTNAYALPSKRKNHDKYRVLERCCEIFAMVIQYFYHQNEWFRLHLRPKDLYCDHAM